MNFRPVIALTAMAGCSLLPAARAQALPVFAHRYGLSCQACHTTVPHLNAFGQAFAAAGFRLPDPRHDALPVAVKVNLQYTSDAQEGLPKAVVDEVELLTGGAIGSKFNYFLEQYAVDGGQPGLPRDAWLQYNSGSTHVRAGQFTLPLPVDPETQRDTESHYLVYDQTVGSNPFAFFDPRIGVDAFVDRNGFTGHLTAVRSYDRQSGNPAQGIDLMGYAAKEAGSATFYAYAYRGHRNLSGIGDAFLREGLGASQNIGRFAITGVLQRGYDSDPGTGSAAFSSGGFLETRYNFSDAMWAVARYDRTSDTISSAQNQTVISLITRPRRNMRFTIEDTITNHHALTLGWLFAY